MIKIGLLIVATAMAPIAAAADTESSQAIPYALDETYALDSLPAPREAPADWSRRPKTLDFLMRDLTPLASNPNEGHAPGSNYYLSVTRVYELAPDLSDPSASMAPPSADLEETVVQGGLETSALFMDQRLALSSGLSWDRTIYDPYWSMGDEPLRDVSTMTYGLGADLAIDDEWTAAAALTRRESSSRRNAEARKFSEAGRLVPSDLIMARLGVQLLKPDWGLRARLTGYAGRIGQAGFESDPNSGLVDLRGIEISLQKKMLDGRLSLELAAMLNSLTTRHALQLASMEGGNLSAYLGLTYTDQALINASIFLHHAEDGNYISQNFLGAMGSTYFWDARIWRDFAFSPALKLSTQIYGSSLIQAYFENLADKDRSASSPYVEGRVTMSYSF